MAHQLPEGRPLLYFNNEQGDTAMLERFQCSALNCTIDRISEDVDKADTHYKTTIGTKIKLIDITGRNVDFIISKCKKYSPGLVVIDQIDPLLTSAETQSQRPYASLYAEIRGIAKEYAPVIGLTQAKFGGRNEDGSYKKWLDLNAMFFSNVDKQANTDVAIGMGCDTPDNPERFFTVCKTKNSKSGAFCAILKKEVSRIEDTL